MPNRSTTIFLAGHGLVSRLRYVSDDKIGEFHIILPSKPGARFCYVAHNMIAQSLLSVTTGDELYHYLQRLEETHGFSSFMLSVPSPLGLPEHAIAGMLREGGISDDLAERMYTPSEPYMPQSIVYIKTIDEYGHIKLKIYMNLNKLSEQLASVGTEDRTNLKIDASHAMYVIPTDKERPFALSKVLDILHKVHIYIDSQPTTGNSEISFVCYSDDPTFNYLALRTSDNSAIFTIPDDANVIWGACREFQDGF